jgi:trans-2,3-dihydro-3-hydroxyanthranilate isomerase
MNSRQSYPYRVVDVFTRQPLEGNPLAVFSDGSELDERTMQKIAKELNLSETVFILPSIRPGCLARLRIFTPTAELAFAGHPTVGASFVLLEQGAPKGSTHFTLDEKVGPVPIRIETTAEGQLIWLTTPPISEGNFYGPAECAAAIGLSPNDLLDAKPQVLSAGNPTLFIPLKDRDAVDRAWPDSGGLKSLKDVHQESMCVFVFTPVPEGAYSRMFAPDHGIAEDPATGSSTGPLALFMMRHNMLPDTGSRLISEQGTKMGRRSVLYVQINGKYGVDGIDVGGYVTPLIEAVLRL